ncbi:MAG: hypothetical protein AAGD11_03025 [Planctomycetota bacterium]
MSNTMRWRYGETNPVMLPVQPGLPIEIGDLVYLESGNVISAANQSDQGTPAANQQAFHDKFVGVAMQCSMGESGESIRIATSGVFEFASVAAAYEVGDLVGGSEDSVGGHLQSQVVEGVGAENLALGRCVKQVATGSTKVLVDIVSTVVRGGPQAAAA